jgi:SET domain-containing protein
MMIEVRPSPIHGRGVFAVVDIPNGSIIERAPFVAMPTGALNGTPLEDLCWTHTIGDLKVDILTLSATTLCNHSNTPNCECHVEGDLDVLYAVRRISAGEELTVDYRTIGGEAPCDYY